MKRTACLIALFVALLLPGLQAAEIDLNAMLRQRLARNRELVQEWVENSESDAERDANRATGVYLEQMVNLLLASYQDELKAAFLLIEISYDVTDYIWDLESAAVIADRVKAQTALNRARAQIASLEAWMAARRPAAAAEPDAAPPTP